MRDPQSILITGASSGIGASLAREYAAPDVTLFLGGRDRERLDAVAAECRQVGADAQVARIDVTDKTATAAWIAEAHAARPLDLVIANAGISGGTGGGGEPDTQVERIYAVNITGVMNTLFPAQAAMKGRGGQIAIISSLAAFRGFPGAPAYCASKAAVRVYGEALRGILHAHGITVSVVCPGYIRSNMTAGNKFWMPMLMDAEKAARIIRRGLARGKARIAFPWPLYLLVRFFAGAPMALTDPLFRRLPKKS